MYDCDVEISRPHLTLFRVQHILASFPCRFHILGYFQIMSNRPGGQKFWFFFAVVVHIGIYISTVVKIKTSFLHTLAQLASSFQPSITSTTEIVPTVQTQLGSSWGSEAAGVLLSRKTLQMSVIVFTPTQNLLHLIPLYQTGHSRLNVLVKYRGLQYNPLLETGMRDRMLFHHDVTSPLSYLMSSSSLQPLLSLNLM